MSTSARRWLTWGLAGLVAGAALGLFIGWWLWPLRYADTSPAYLHDDYRSDYVLMIATTYQVDGDVEAARDRLASINPADPVAPVADLSRRLRQAGGREGTIQLLADLIAALAQDSGDP